MFLEEYGVTALVAILTTLNDLNQDSLLEKVMKTRAINRMVFKFGVKKLKKVE